jgi:hypothetical protein
LNIVATSTDSTRRLQLVDDLEGRHLIAVVVDGDGVPPSSELERDRAPDASRSPGYQRNSAHSQTPFPKN